jgi:hypothetical protein
MSRDQLPGATHIRRLRGPGEHVDSGDSECSCRRGQGCGHEVPEQPHHLGDQHDRAIHHDIAPRWSPAHRRRSGTASPLRRCVHCRVVKPWSPRLAVQKLRSLEPCRPGASHASSSRGRPPVPCLQYGPGTGMCAARGPTAPAEGFRGARRQCLTLLTRRNQAGRCCHGCGRAYCVRRTRRPAARHSVAA